MNFYENVAHIFKDWNYGHPYVLYGLIRSLKPRVAIEIGTYRGFGAAWMAKALQENNRGTLYCVDNFSLTDHEAKYGNAYKHLIENLTKLGVIDFVRILSGESSLVTLPEQIDFAYIDGWHSYDAVKQDFINCANRGAEVICLDDTVTCVGPRLFAENPPAEAEAFDRIDIHRDNGLTIFVRRQKKPSPIFSQELPYPNPGVMLNNLTEEEQLKHLQEATLVTGLDYSRFVQPR